jgi:hypothetical protein
MTNPLCRMALLCLVALPLTACPATPPSSTPPPPPAPAPSSPDPPPTPSAYPRPPSIRVEDLARVLPRDAEGRPILTTVEGTDLSIGPKRVDPIGAAAGCSDLKNDCMQVTGDGDTCIATVKRCSSSEPWLEAEACCPAACVDAYQEQRRLGAPPSAANAAVFGSTHECFPGLQELIRATGGTPRLMPRRTP